MEVVRIGKETSAASLFFRPYKSRVIPAITRVKAALASNAARENCKCQGEMANRNIAHRAIVSDFPFTIFHLPFTLSSKSLLVRKYINMIAKVPRSADGNLTENSERPKNLMKIESR